MSSKSKTRDNPLITFAVIAAKSVVFTFLWIPVYIFRCLLVYYVANYQPNYGKILNQFDSTLQEQDYHENPPKSSMVFTLVLDTPIKLDKLRQLFIQNVLKAKISNKKGKDELKYPELKQYQTDLLGYTFWKDDPTFQIENHITGLPYTSEFENLSKIHTKVINEVYKENRSPWEMILVNNYKNEANKSLIILRFHHSLGDTKSVLKVVVENLGGKQLSMPNVQYKQHSLLDKIHFYFLLPFYFVYSQLYLHYIRLEGQDCHLHYRKEDKDTLLNVAISRPVVMNDIKAVAKANKVTSSAVIMAAVTGGVAKLDERLSRNGVPCTWGLPRPDHPDILANHNYSGAMVLPTHIKSPDEMLKTCHEIFNMLKSTNLYKYDESVLFQTGTWFNPLRAKWLKRGTFPLLVTNIAGEGKGFSIGTSPVSEFTMTCGPLRGTLGLLICGFSYKDKIELSASAKNGVLNEAETQKLVYLIEKEFEILSTLSIKNQS